MRLGYRRAAVLAVAVFFSSMASLYVPAARAAQLPRVPRVPDKFMPTDFTLSLGIPVWSAAGTASFA
ncbi:hypothetical protein LO772_05865 [Yinghuangia sp. ASG 101]|uniref:hypothetical protein n=1 Tax=Yinghuangia sp. ASG 101 TaxID=2896848 RepID=UPI001E3B7D8E|nr:hypothetical protein [Yinghuangia sp. ASG 101]UGQ13143.1 hypothetical protein LO772_05865 [Yinghuangia sp. ASG 101]